RPASLQRLGLAGCPSPSRRPRTRVSRHPPPRSVHPRASSRVRDSPRARCSGTARSGMTSPLARPPYGAGVKTAAQECPPARAPSALARVMSELGDGIHRVDGRRLAWHAAAVLPDFAFPRVRARLLAAVGCDVERGVGVLGYVHLIGPQGSAANLRVGTGSVIGPGVKFCLDAAVVVGANVSIGPCAMLYTA